MKNAADDFAAIAQRLREIAQDRDEAQKQRADEPAWHRKLDELLTQDTARTDWVAF